MVIQGKSTYKNLTLQHQLQNNIQTPIKTMSFKEVWRLKWVMRKNNVPALSIKDRMVTYIIIDNETNNAPTYFVFLHWVVTGR